MALPPFALSAGAVLRCRGSRATVLLVLLTLFFAAVPVLVQAAPTVPVRVRIIKGSRQGPPAVDPKLTDVAAQLGRLAYQRWDQVGEQQKDMESGKPVSFPLPDGATLELTLVDAKKDTVTFDVRVGAKTHSRMTIAKDQRIVHQVADEKNGVALFATVRPWP